VILLGRKKMTETINNVEISQETMKNETINLGVSEMTQGFEEIFLPALQQIYEELNQIKVTQEELIKCSTERNSDFEKTPYIEDIEKTVF
jgi:hypothetical protein